MEFKVNVDNLDVRERELYEAVDSYVATRFRGRANFDRLEGFKTLQDIVNAIIKVYEEEAKNYPPPADFSLKPFAVYGISSKHGGSQVHLLNIYRDLTTGISLQEVRAKRDAAKKGRK